MTVLHDSLSRLLMKHYEHSLDLIFFFNQQGQILYMNHSAKNTLQPEKINQLIEQESNSFCLICRGYTSESELQTCRSCFLTHPEQYNHSFQLFLETKDRGVIPYSASFQVIDEKDRITVCSLRDLSKQLQTQDTLNQKRLIVQTVKAQEDERKRISRELHDSVAQELLSLLVEIRLLKYMNINEDVKQKVFDAEGSLSRLLDYTQQLAFELRPATLDDLGLEAAFRTHFKWIEKNYGIMISFQSDLNAQRYNGEKETVVYRICQEAILNAIKYAQTEDIHVSLWEENNHLCLKVKDKGIGFRVNAYRAHGTGLGLYGMRERAELVEGELTIASAPHKGTTIELKIPLKQGRQ